MPGPTPDPIESAADQPARADAVVVGGGVIGACAALELAERGLSVVLCEKGVVAGEQSSRNWGWVRLTRRDPREIDLMSLSIRLWGELAGRVGADVGYRRCGVVAPFFSEAEREDAAAWLAHLDGRQHRVSLIDAAETARLTPGSTLKPLGALYAPEDGRAEPQAAAPAVARAAQARGVRLLQGCAVRRIETAGGRVTGVVTERGRIETPLAVAAGGVWTRLLLRDAGVTLPQLRILNSVLRTAPIAGGPQITVRGPGFSARKREDGGYTVSALSANLHSITPDSFRFLSMYLPVLRKDWRSVTPRLDRGFLDGLAELRRWGADDETPFERVRVLDPAPDAAMTDRALARLTEAFPIFERAEVAQRWGGMIDVTPDAVPVISPAEGVDGLIVASGFSGHGFGLGPGAGRLAAELATGVAPSVDPAPYRLSRFFDGSKITPLTGI